MDLVEEMLDVIPSRLVLWAFPIRCFSRVSAASVCMEAKERDAEEVLKDSKFTLVLGLEPAMQKGEEKSELDRWNEKLWKLDEEKKSVDDFKEAEARLGAYLNEKQGWEKRTRDVGSTQRLDGYPIRISPGSISVVEATEFRSTSMLYIYILYIIYM